MRISLLLRFALAVIVLVPSFRDMQALQASGVDPAESQLVQAFRLAHNRQDLVAASRLFCWDGVTREIRHITERHLSESFDEPMLTVKMTDEHPKGRLDQFIKNGTTYTFNLPVVKELVVETGVISGTPQLTYYPVGLKDGHYAIALMAPVEIGTTGPAMEKPAPPAETSPVTKTGKITLPGGTALTVRLDQNVGVNLIGSGGDFSATLIEPVQGNGVIVIPAGATAAGVVTKKAPYSPEMTLQSITFNGRSLKVRTAPITFNQAVSFPAGTQESFHLFFSMYVSPQ